MRRLNGCSYVLALGLIVLLTGSVWAEVCKGSKVPRAALADYDARARLSSQEHGVAIHIHLPYGQPACPRVLAQHEYVLCYDPANRVALWAAYQLKAEDVVLAKRLDAFRTDPRLSDEENASCSDYAGTGYARGHLVPRDDMNRSAAAQANTFYLSNMSPQISAFNSGIWARLERRVRDYAKHYGQVYVITGSVLQSPIQRLPSGRVAVPQRFYKVILRTGSGGIPEAVAIVLPHLPFRADPRTTRARIGEAADAYLAAHTVSIMEIQNLTGLDVLPKVDREALKRAVASELWPRN